jgi:hypothetical protein
MMIMMMMMMNVLAIRFEKSIFLHEQNLHENEACKPRTHTALRSLEEEKQYRIY